MSVDIDKTIAKNASFFAFVDTAVDTLASRVPEIDRDAMRLLMTLRRAFSIVFYDVHVELRRKSHLNTALLRVLLVVYVCGQIELRQLTHLAGISRATASAMTDRLTKEGLVTRTSENEDRRTVTIEITSLGYRELETAFSAHNEREVYWAEALDQDEQEELVRLLKKLVDDRLKTGDVHHRS